MIAGQQMDLYRSRYETFEELNLTVTALDCRLDVNGGDGVDSSHNTAAWNHNQEPCSPTEEAIALELQPTHQYPARCKMHLGAYLSSTRLSAVQPTLSKQDLFKGVVDQRWRELMRFQIQRTRQVWRQKGISRLSPDARPVGGADALQSDFDVIERNHYDVFRQRAYVPRMQQIRTLPVAWLRSQVL